eukprot:CAMPEP_0195511894 /NCGR_PEP_ID=MMETSP0794_2-20130614/4051_1 /TAXON_ID=515487 /ORGANISM="Stephanopyxis turris, Strain CCMP 815" /LENGTH=160 /DNA_ID=CAMNT_0040639569 /DNA_START=704 /DNA_END=1187 /DNA_ORIENTATION=+
MTSYDYQRAKVKNKNSFVPVPIGWSCSQCCWVPLSLRANGSVVVGKDPPDKCVVRIHNEKCKGHRLHLENVLNLVKGMVESVPLMTFDTLVHPAFKAIISALVGHNEELVTVLTDGVRDEYFGMVSDGGGRSGLWTLFPGKVKKDEVLVAMVAFAFQGWD